MADLTTPAETDAAILSTATGHAVDKAGTGSWIVDGVDIAGVYSSVDETVLNAFNYNTTDSSGLDAVIDPGEAYVAGWLCRDTQTTVTLPASETVDVYVGYDESAVLSSGTAPADNENIIVGLDGDFAASDPRTHIWTFSTDSTSIIDSLDRRKLQKPIEFTPTGGLTATDDLTVDGSTTFNSAVDIEAQNSHIDLIETDEGTTWRVEGQTGNFYVREVGGVGTSLRIDPSDGGRVEHPNGGAFGGDVALNGANLDITGRIDVRDTSTQIRVHETDTGAQWNTAVSSGNFNLVESGGSGLLQLFAGGNVEVPNGDLTANNVVAGNVLDSGRGTAVVSGSERYIWVSGDAPSDSQGNDGDIWIEH